MDTALGELNELVLACEASGDIEAKHIDLAKTVIKKRGGGAKNKTPIQRVQDGHSYLSGLLAEATP